MHSQLLTGISPGQAAGKRWKGSAHILLVHFCVNSIFYSEKHSQSKVTSKLTQRSKDCKTSLAYSSGTLCLLCLPLATTYSDDILRTPLIHDTTLVCSPVSTKNCLSQGLLYINLEGQLIFTSKDKEHIFWVDHFLYCLCERLMLHNSQKRASHLKTAAGKNLRWHLPCDRHCFM